MIVLQYCAAFPEAQIIAAMGIGYGATKSHDSCMMPALRIAVE